MLPDYYVARPAMPGSEVLDAFAQLWSRHLRSDSPEIEYCLDAPRWQFLCWLADAQDVVLHGSGRADIEIFEPRRPGDESEFANREAVFAASDGIWAMFYSIIDRAVAWSLVNACFSVWSDERCAAAVHYYFSVNEDALSGHPFGSGAVYVLPRATFERQADDDDGDGVVAVSQQWASLTAVRPLGHLVVTPDDFPFLADVNGHDQKVVAARAAADPDAFPWRE